MPYTVSDPPAAIKGMPKHAVEIFVAAFNAAFDEYKGDEAKSNATAWSAVKGKYHKDEQGEWIAKEAKAIRTLIAKDVDVVEISCPQCHGDAFEPEGALLKCCSCGLLVEHKQEANMTTIADIIQEAAKRGKTRDPKVAALVGENKPAPEAVAEVMAWLKEQAMMKTEDGQAFPAEAFAYCPDAEKPSEWKLRLWEDPEKKATKAQLGRAAAALGPGGFRGQKVEIPAADMAAVKRKIRSAYRSLDVSDDAIPKAVMEAHSRELIADHIPLAESAAVHNGKGVLTIIKPGFNSSKGRYYPAEVIARDMGIFEGVKMYADHATDAEDKARPERSIRDWVASLGKPYPAADGSAEAAYTVVEPWFEAKLATLRDKGMLGEMEVSINAVGEATRAEIQGVKTNLIERLVRARSVDFVTEAGAGGKVNVFEAAESETDVDLVDITQLKERRGDLVRLIESEVENKYKAEAKKHMETDEKIKTLETSVATLTTERDALTAKIAEAEKATRIAEAKSKIDEAISKSELPEAAKSRVAARFAGAEKAEGITEAIKAESDYIAAVRESGKVKGLGDSKKPEVTKDQLKESFKRMGMSDKEADIAANGR